MRGVLAVWLVVARVASADPSDPNPEAEKLFKDGLVAFEAGDIARACDAFAASSKLGPSVGTYLNLGRCRAQLGQVATAWAAYVEAARLAKSFGETKRIQLEEAQHRAAELEPELSYIQLAVSSRAPGETLTRDGIALDPSAWGPPIATDPGTHVFVATAPNYRAITVTSEVKPNGDHVTVKIPALVVRPANVVTAPPQPIFSRLRWTAVVVGGLGVAAAGGVGLGYAIDAKILDSDALGKCPANQPCHDQDAAAKSRLASHRASIATGFAIGGGVAIAAGAVMWLVGKPAETVHVTPAVTRDGAAVLLEGAF